ncbi:hypothetical protein OXYTRIMIC_451 [Oxytricha trifallax]|uniref:Uncharacterized protein n=1 Tax=Oxytricha trifallax TaxID=1172189 RepID=A0A073IB48_9SPIT|nr:hypothetical protein OXYTRIMIC_451 [Oxytricha trifallax]
MESHQQLQQVEQILQQFVEWQTEFKHEHENDRLRFDDGYFNKKLIMSLIMSLETQYFKNQQFAHVFKFKKDLMDKRNPEGLLYEYEDTNKRVMSSILSKEKYISKDSHQELVNYMQSNELSFLLSRIKREGYQSFIQRIKSKYPERSETWVNIGVKQMMVTITARNLMLYTILKGSTQIEIGSRNEVQFLANLFIVPENFIISAVKLFQSFQIIDQDMRDRLTAQIQSIKEQAQQKIRNINRSSQQQNISKRKPKQATWLDTIAEMEESEEESQQPEMSIENSQISIAMSVLNELVNEINEEEEEKYQQYQECEEMSITPSVLEQALSDTNTVDNQVNQTNIYQESKEYDEQTMREIEEEIAKMNLQ